MHSLKNNNNNSHTPLVEVKLLKDDEWKRIQQNTFTRWVNQHLKNAPGSPKVENLATDFHDGILLIQLAEVLAQRNLARFNRKPTMRTQKLDNISTVLNFFQKEEDIKIVNIDSSHIADHNLKLILGLVWTLILHYALSQPISGTLSSTESGAVVGDDYKDNAGTVHEHPSPSPRKSGASSSTSEQHQQQQPQQSPKKRLLVWIQERVPHRRVANFTTDWTNGIVLGALVDACLGADAFPEWRQWEDNDDDGASDDEDALLNTRRAMQAAEDGLGVGQLITPEELTNPNVDEKSVMTYLSQFPRARPLLLGRLTGLHPLHPIAHVPCRFRVQMERPTLRPSVDIVDPRGHMLLPPGGGVTSSGGTNHGGISMVRAVDDEHYSDNASDDGGDGGSSCCPTYNVSFTPAQIGDHKVTVYAQNVADPLGPRLPIETVVVTAVPAPELVGLEGDDGGVVQGQRHRFKITNVNDASQLDVMFVDPSGREIILDVGSERDEQTVTCCYTPSTPGKHMLSVLYRKCHIPRSPFTLNVLPNNNNNQTGNDAHNISNGAIVFDNDDNQIISSYEMPPPSDDEALLFRRHSLRNGGPPVSPKRQSSTLLPMVDHLAVAAGPGLEKGYTGQPNLFTVCSSASADNFLMTMDGPEKAQISVEDDPKMDGLIRVKYYVDTPGDYRISMLIGETHINGSPFLVPVHSSTSSGLVVEEEAVEENEEAAEVTTMPAGSTTTTVATQVVKTTTSYIITPQQQYTDAEVEGHEYSSDDPTPVTDNISNNTQLHHHHSTNSASNGDAAALTMATMTSTAAVVRSPSIVDVVHHMTRRREELRYEPLGVSTPAGTVTSSGPTTPHGALRSLYRERSADHFEAAAMVAVQGHGLQDFVPGQPAQFTVDASQTDFSCPKALFVGVVTSHGPAEKVTVEHLGGGRYDVLYTVHDDADALVFVKYGKNNVDGSPFSVRPMRSHNSKETRDDGNAGNNYYRM